MEDCLCLGSDLTQEHTRRASNKPRESLPINLKPFEFDYQLGEQMKRPKTNLKQRRKVDAEGDLTERPLGTKA